jgi:hypothetical protein
MSSFLSGLASVGKAAGGAVKDWAQGTKIGRDIDKGRNLIGSFSAKKQPGMSGKGDATPNDPSGPQSA